MDITVSYTPTPEDRMLEIKSTGIIRLRRWWLVGAPLTIVAVGVLARLAARSADSVLNGCTALAAVLGVVLMVLPHRVVEAGVRRELSGRPLETREVTLTDDGIRVRVPGMSSEIAWSKVWSVTETPAYWRIASSSMSELHLPKRVLSEGDAAQVSGLLSGAVRRYARSTGD